MTHDRASRGHQRVLGTAAALLVVANLALASSTVIDRHRVDERVDVVDEPGATAADPDAAPAVSTNSLVDPTTTTVAPLPPVEASSTTSTATTTAAVAPTPEPPPTTETTLVPARREVGDGPVDCAAPDGPDLEATDEVSAHDRIIGTWYACNDSAFGNDEGGFEITADGEWFMLDRDGDRAFARRGGFREWGTWDLLALPSSVQLNLHCTDGSTYVIQAVWERDAPRVRLNNNGVHVGDYVRVAAPSA